MKNNLWDIVVYFLLLLATCSDANPTTTALEKRRISKASLLWRYVHGEEFSGPRRKLLTNDGDPWEFQYLAKDEPIFGFTTYLAGQSGVFVVTNRAMEGCRLKNSAFSEMATWGEGGIELNNDEFKSLWKHGCLAAFQRGFASDEREGRMPQVAAIFIFALSGGLSEYAKSFSFLEPFIRDSLVEGLGQYGVSGDNIHLLPYPADKYDPMLAMKQGPIGHDGSSYLEIYSSGVERNGHMVGGDLPAARIKLENVQDYEVVEVDCKEEETPGMDVWFETAEIYTYPTCW